MKTIRLLLMIVLAGIGQVVNAQESYLPQKNSFSVGGGFMWGMSEGKGDFQDVAGTPTCGSFALEYRHYPTPGTDFNLAIGAVYNRLWGKKDGNTLRCNYIAPALTGRWLWAENKQGFHVTVGLGYLHYKDDLNGLAPFDKGYFAASVGLGYEFAIGKGVGMQIRADIIMADFKSASYRSCCYDNYYDNLESNLDYFSLGVAFVFGK